MSWNGAQATPPPWRQNGHLPPAFPAAAPPPVYAAPPHSLPYGTPHALPPPSHALPPHALPPHAPPPWAARPAAGHAMAARGAVAAAAAAAPTPLTPWGTPSPIGLNNISNNHHNHHNNNGASASSASSSSSRPPPEQQASVQKRRGFKEDTGRQRDRPASPSSPGRTRRRRPGSSSRSPARRRRRRRRDGSPKRMRRLGMWLRPAFTEEGPLDFESTSSSGGEEREDGPLAGGSQAVAPAAGGAPMPRAGTGLSKYLPAEEIKKFYDQAQGTYEDDADRKISSTNKGMKMLKRMGWNEGKGLGKNESGIVDPVTAKLRSKGAGIGADGDPSRPKPGDDNYALYQKRMMLSFKARKWSGRR